MTGGAVDPATVGRALQAHLEAAGTSLLLHDRATGETLALPAELVGQAAGLLPVFLVAGEAVWREATGKGFALRIRPDREALLGYRVDGIGEGTFCSVALSAMEAIEQARPDEPGRLLVNELIGSVWRAVLDRADRSAPMAAGAATSTDPSGPSPSLSPTAGTHS